MKLTWLGHGSWRIEIEKAVILVDPALDANPSFPEDRRDEAVAGTTHILITHGHGDHTSGVPALAKRLGVPVVGIADSSPSGPKARGWTAPASTRAGPWT